MTMGRVWVALMGGAVLSACMATPTVPPTQPQARPATTRPAVSVRPATPPSAQSQSLRRYYSAVQADMLAQGLMRMDGGGPDTPFDADILVRNFERIAFYDEYELGSIQKSRATVAGTLRRWQDPVRIGIEFGPSVPAAMRAMDTQTITQYAARLGRVTNHPISAVKSGANFHVFIMSEDDRAALPERVRQIVPNLNSGTIELLRNMPRSLYCVVIAFGGTQDDSTYKGAIALVRAEHPDLMRRSCIHEEVAQGLGLANDSPAARPSIFNDDDEFSLLTTHDEMLLRMLYDPRLSPGMSLSQAHPILQDIANSLLPPPS